jgi:hypothetical protein
MTDPTEKREKQKKSLSELRYIEEGKYIYWSTGLYMTQTRQNRPINPKNRAHILKKKKGKEQERKRIILDLVMEKQ